MVRLHIIRSYSVAQRFAVHVSAVMLFFLNFRLSFIMEKFMEIGSSLFYFLFEQTRFLKIVFKLSYF